MNKTLTLLFILLFLVNCSHLLNKNHSSNPDESGVNIPEKVGVSPEVLIKDILNINRMTAPSIINCPVFMISL